MSAYQITGICVGAVALLGVSGRVLWAIHKGVNLIEHLVDRVGSLEKTLSNGIRSDVRKAAEEAKEARVLAAQAAASASIAQQRAEEGRSNIERAVNSLRAEINAMTNVALNDHAEIWRTLREAGHDRRSDDQ